MSQQSDSNEDNSLHGSDTPLLGSKTMSSGEHELLYSGGGTTPAQQRNKLGLRLDVEADNQLTESRLQSHQKPEPVDNDVEVKVEAGGRKFLLCNCCNNMSVLVYLLVIIFGSGSWIAINGIWVELPLLVPQLPEGWDLPSYLSVAIQLANIGPLIFFVAFTLNPNKVKEKPVVYAIVIVGAVSCFLLAFFWRDTSYIGGVEHSTALLLLTFFLAFVDCTSSVVFLPFMAIFPEEYMTAFYIGEGFSGLTPSLVSLGQGAGNYNCTNVSVLVNKTINGTTEVVEDWKVVMVLLEPNFSVEDFYFFLFVMMTVCGIAFILLNFLPHCKSYHLTEDEPGALSGDKDTENGHLNDSSPHEEAKYFETFPERKPLTPVAGVADVRVRSPLGKLTHTDETDLPSPIRNNFSEKTRVKHCSTPGAMTTGGLPDATDQDDNDSVFEPPTSTPCRRRYHSVTSITRQHSFKPSSRRTSSFGPMELTFSRPDLHPVLEDREEMPPPHSPVTPAGEPEPEDGKLERFDYVYLLSLITVVNALSNGVLPSTQTYSALPYGSLVYSLVVRLCNVMNPLACFVAFFVPTKSYKSLGAITVVAVCCAVYTLVLAGMSPHPPLYDSVAGDVVTILVWLACSGLFSYSKVMVAMILRDDGRNGLLWCGALTQVGSTIGAVVTFVLVNVLHLFTSASHCTT